MAKKRYNGDDTRATNGRSLAYCPRCDKKMYKKNLLRHIVETHAKVLTIFKCPKPNCASEFSNESNFIAHYRAKHMKGLKKKKKTLDMIEEPHEFQIENVDFIPPRPAASQPEIDQAAQNDQTEEVLGI